MSSSQLPLTIRRADKGERYFDHRGKRESFHALDGNVVWNAYRGAALIGSVQVSVYREDWEGLIDEELGPFYWAYDAEDGVLAKLDSIYVVPRERGSGTGHLLLDQVANLGLPLFADFVNPWLCEHFHSHFDAALGDRLDLGRSTDFALNRAYEDAFESEAGEPQLTELCLQVDRSRLALYVACHSLAEGEVDLPAYALAGFQPELDAEELRELGLRALDARIASDEGTIKLHFRAQVERPQLLRAFAAAQRFRAHLDDRPQPQDLVSALQTALLDRLDGDEGYSASIVTPLALSA